MANLERAPRNVEATGDQARGVAERSLRVASRDGNTVPEGQPASQDTTPSKPVKTARVGVGQSVPGFGNLYNRMVENNLPQYESDH